MRLCSFLADGSRRAGAVVGDEVVDLADADGDLPADMAGILAAGLHASRRIAGAIASGRGRRPLAEVTLTAPVQPGKFFIVGLNYADHAAEAGLPAPDELTVAGKAVSSVVGPYDAIECPSASGMVDYEGELGFVIGARCRHVRAEEARSVIAGYVIVNDVSVRDWQFRTSQWTLGKSFDTHGPTGPWISTADEIGDPHATEIRTFVNGELRQRSNTSNLIFDCFKIVEILSTVCTLEPGDLVATGTPAGVALSMDPQPWLVPGDSVRIEIDGIGAIENPVVGAQAGPAAPPAAAAPAGDSAPSA